MVSRPQPMWLPSQRMADAENQYPDDGPNEPPAPDTTAAAPPPGTVLDGLKIVMPSGQEFPVLVELEVEFMRDRIWRYLSDNHFVNISDLADLDKILINEMFVFRWQHWCSMGHNYLMEESFSEATLRKMIGDYTRETRLLKEQLGVDKTSRDKAKGEDSVAEYMRMLPMRAREFGVHRDDQVSAIYDLGMQFIALLTFHDNADEEERRELGITIDDLMSWVRKVFVPRLQAKDDAFRLNQRIWIRDL